MGTEQSDPLHNITQFHIYSKIKKSCRHEKYS